MSCCMSSTVTESRLSDANSSRAMVWQRPALFGFGSFGSFGRAQGHGRCRFCCARPRCIVPSRTNPWSHMRMAWQSFQAGCSHFGASKIVLEADLVYSPALQLVAFTTVYKKEYSKKLLRSSKTHIFSEIHLRSRKRHGNDWFSLNISIAIFQIVDPA